MARYDAPSYKRPENVRKTLDSMSPFLKEYRADMIFSALAALANGVIGVFGTYSYKTIINDFILAGDRQGLVRAVLILGCIYVCGALATLVYSQTMTKAAQGIVYSLRAALFSKMQKLPLSFFDRHSSGDLMSRFTNDIEAITEGLATSYPALIQAVGALVSTITMMALLSPPLGLAVIVCQALTTVYIRYATRRSRHFYTEQQRHLGRLNGFLEEITAGQKVVKIFNHEQQVLEEFGEFNEDLKDAAVHGATYTGIMVPTVIGMSYLNYALAAVGGGLLCIHGKMDLGSLTAFLVCVRQGSMPINQITRQSTSLLAALASAERIFSLLNEEPETDQGSVVLTADQNGEPVWNDPESGSLVPLRGDIRFEDVSFGYVPEKTVLHGISFHAEASSKAAFVGSTGAGKTTVINLVNRFYEAGQGTICYDGIDIRRIRKKDLRENVAIIVQTTHLFTGTIADNIRYGKIGASDEEVAEAARLARADSFIRRLPEGYRTMLRNDGDNLSQGQRQLLSIARAAIARPSVLVLDEATSSIDTRTERLIEQGLDSLMEGRTVLVIAHRLSTVRESDNIMVIEKGRIIEHGSHEELIRSGGQYARLYSGQFELD